MKGEASNQIIAFERQKRKYEDSVKKAFYINAALNLDSKSSNQFLLVDSGADYLTLSKAVATTELELDLTEQRNLSLEKKYHKYGYENPVSFLRTEWLKNNKKAIRTETALATGSVQCILYPLEIEFENGIGITMPVNFMETSVEIPLLGRRPLWDYCRRMVFDSKNGNGRFELLSEEKRENLLSLFSD